MRPFAIHWVFGILLCGWVSCCPLPAADETLQEVIAAVAANERLYASLDVVLRSEYNIGDRTPIDGAAALPGLPGSAGGGVSRRSRQIRSVTQGDWFRLEIEGVSLSSGKSRNCNLLCAYDGTTTRRLDRNALGTLRAGRWDDDRQIRPHLLSLYDAHIPVPLSVYLSGREAVLAHPGSRGLQNLDATTATYQGQEEIDGLACVKVQVATELDGKIYNTDVLWLARDRNYLPIRRQAFTYKVSRREPLGRARLHDLREIQTGVWLPFAAEITVRDAWEMQQGQDRLRWRERFVVESVTLDPKYDREFFAKVDFPAGIEPQEIENTEVKPRHGD